MNHSEESLLAALTDPLLIGEIAESSLSPEMIPTEAIRPVFTWAMNYYYESGRTQAPSREALLEIWGDHLEQAEIELPDEGAESDTPASAVEALAAQYVLKAHQDFVMEASAEIASAAPIDRLRLLKEHAARLSAIALTMQPRRVLVSVKEGLAESADRYFIREADGLTHKGMTFGLGAIDAYTYGIHPGELAVLAAGPKTGKSFFLLLAALHQWRDQRRPTALFTLENSVEMTYDRLICCHLGIDPDSYQRGALSEEDKRKVIECRNDTIKDLAEGLFVVMPEPGNRTVDSLIRQAKMLDAQSVMLDQLTFIDHPDPGRKPRNEIIRDIMHETKQQISTSRDPISVLMAHQINREGMKAAAKQDYLEMHHLAEGSEVERSVDWAFSLYNSRNDVMAQMMKFQTLAARRTKPKSWYLQWRIERAHVRVLSEQDFEANSNGGE